MKLEYYTKIKEALESVPALKNVTRWKNQLQAESVINAIPSAYIEFVMVNYDDMTRKRQSAVNVTFIIHLIVEKYTTEDADDVYIYELSQRIYKALHSLKGISRVSESMDVTPDKLEDFQLIYTIERIEDGDAQDETETTIRPSYEGQTEIN